jgi:hypothetical protein
MKTECSNTHLESCASRCSLDTSTTRIPGPASADTGFTPYLGELLPSMSNFICTGSISAESRLLLSLLSVQLVTIIKSQLGRSSKSQSSDLPNSSKFNLLVAANDNMCNRWIYYFSCGHVVPYSVVHCARKRANPGRSCPVIDKHERQDYPCDQCV